jgi:hypothetical protein
MYKYIYIYTYYLWQIVEKDMVDLKKFIEKSRISEPVKTNEKCIDIQEIPESDPKP